MRLSSNFPGCNFGSKRPCIDSAEALKRGKGCDISEGHRKIRCLRKKRDGLRAASRPDLERSLTSYSLKVFGNK